MLQRHIRNARTAQNPLIFCLSRHREVQTARQGRRPKESKTAKTDENGRDRVQGARRLHVHFKGKEKLGAWEGGVQKLTYC